MGRKCVFRYSDLATAMIFFITSCIVKQKYRRNISAKIYKNDAQVLKMSLNVFCFEKNMLKFLC